MSPVPGVSFGKLGPSCPAGQQPCQGKSCCEAYEVEGGTFPMGSCTNGCSDQPMAGYPHERPEHDVTVSSFYLDTYEVTVGRFRRFVAQYTGAGLQDGAGANPHVPGSGWKSAWNAKLPASRQLLEQQLHCDAEFATWTDAPAGHETLPINCVTWYEAFAFCVWDGGRLPTEAEWEYAAAGGAENRLYPCGKPTGDVPAVYACTADGSSAFSCSPGDILPVGSRPKGGARWGHQDMAGGMFEWVLDWYDSDWYASGGNDCHDCANLTPGIERVQRGGSWDNDANPLRAAYRWFGSPTERSKEVGIRCARLP